MAAWKFHRTLVAVQTPHDITHPPPIALSPLLPFAHARGTCIDIYPRRVTFHPLELTVRKQSYIANNTSKRRSVGLVTKK
jgi:hypothetical protein